MAGGFAFAFLAAAIAVSALGSAASALDSDLFFYVMEGHPKCFFEELPLDVTLIGAYKHGGDAEKKPLEISVSGPDHAKVLMSVKVPPSGTGRFAHHSDVAGEYQICVKSAAGTTWPATDKTAKFHLRIQLSGKDAKLDTDVAKKGHINDLEAEIARLDERLDLLVSDIDYSKQQESHFRNQSEQINSRIMWWSILQTTLLISAGMWQIIHLKAFFRKKKLV